MTTEQAIFESLPLRRRNVVAISQEEYAITSKSGEIKQVKANTAYEAFKMSGLSDAIRIERRAVMRESVLPKARFVNEAAAPDAGDAMDGIGQGGVVRLHSPVVTAEDLDMMIRAMQNASAEMLPAPEAQAETVVTSPTGVEVHGDGFDELIPATPAPVHPSGAKPVTTLTEAQASLIDTPSPAELPPEQELSPEEVNKLLNGQ